MYHKLFLFVLLLSLSCSSPSEQQLLEEAPSNVSTSYYSSPRMIIETVNEIGSKGEAEGPTLIQFINQPLGDVLQRVLRNPSIEEEIQQSKVLQTTVRVDYFFPGTDKAQAIDQLANALGEKYGFRVKKDTLMEQVTVLSISDKQKFLAQSRVQKNIRGGVVSSINRRAGEMIVVKPTFKELVEELNRFFHSEYLIADQDPGKDINLSGEDVLLEFKLYKLNSLKESLEELSEKYGISNYNKTIPVEKYTIGSI